MIDSPLFIFSIFSQHLPKDSRPILSVSNKFQNIAEYSSKPTKVSWKIYYVSTI